MYTTFLTGVVQVPARKDRPPDFDDITWFNNGSRLPQLSARLEWNKNATTLSESISAAAHQNKRIFFRFSVYLVFITMHVCVSV